MIPSEKIESIVIKYDALEKELSTGKVEPKLLRQKI